MDKQSFFFYDLETSGFDPKSHRIMQFAGQRTDAELNNIGEPVNVLIKLTDDVLPDPQAVLVTGITPQKTHQEGYSEADFLRLLYQEVLLPNTIIAGFNSVRFDDEFMRYTLYRNFYDPYEWAWQQGRSRWDVLDAIRMTRALRPDGIKWPFDQDSQPTNRLELLSGLNGLNHEKAHDALSDVQALIGVARLIKQKQPKLFDYLLKLRDKKEVAKLVNLDQPGPFVYTTGQYPKDYLHTSVAYPLSPGGNFGTVVVYDLRFDPTTWAKKSVAQLNEIRFAKKELRQTDGFAALPAKELNYSRCPAVAPLGVLDNLAQERIKIDLNTVQTNLAKLQKTDLADKLREVFTRKQFPKNGDVDTRLYDGFVNEADKTKMAALRAAGENLADFNPGFIDERLSFLLPRYKARNFPHLLSQDELATWEEYRSNRLKREMADYVKQINALGGQAQTTDSHFLLSELQLWAESIMPTD